MASQTLVSSILQVTSIQLEFRALSQATGDPRYEEAVARVSRHVHNLHKPHGLVPIWIDPSSGEFGGSTITLGARGDSYYEYLLKQWLQGGRREPALRQDYEEAITGVSRHRRIYIGEEFFFSSKSNLSLNYLALLRMKKIAIKK